MRMPEELRIFPFMPGGAAHGMALPAGAVALTDMTARARFGLKGPGSADWLTRQGVPLPSVNRIGFHGDARVLRLGREDIVLLAEGAGETLAKLETAWHADAASKGYSSWREEGWAWMRLSGPGLDEGMSRLCALDLRHSHFGADEIAQTRVGHVEAVLFRSGGAFDVLFDITVSAFFARTVAVVTKHCTQDNHSKGIA